MLFIKLLIFLLKFLLIAFIFDVSKYKFFVLN